MCQLKLRTLKVQDGTCRARPRGTVLVTALGLVQHHHEASHMRMVYNDYTLYVTHSIRSKFIGHITYRHFHRSLVFSSSSQWSSRQGCAGVVAL